MGPLGAFACAADGRVGDAVDGDAVRHLGQTLLAGVLEVSPSPLDETEDPNAGWQASSAENALVYGHPLASGASYLFSTGAIVRKNNIVYAPPGTSPQIPPPTDPPTPIMAADLDAEYAAAVLDVLERGDEHSRRVSPALEWVALGTSNTTALRADGRVLAWRAGFEVLLAGGASTRTNRHALSQLLDPPKEPRQLRRRPRAQKVVRLTDLEWWLVHFAELRNTIAHGAVINDADSRSRATPSRSRPRRPAARHPPHRRQRLRRPCAPRRARTRARGAALGTSARR